MISELVAQIDRAKYDRALPRYTSYPTAPHFKPVEPPTYQSWLRTIPHGTSASLYVHVPFCAALCWYCGCHTHVVRGHTAIAEYARLLEREMGLVADEAPDLRATAVHWGGGTPSLLAGDELARLMDAAGRRFNLVSDAEISAELDPRVLSAKRVRALAAAGVNRASLGVQDFDPAVQQAINRIQPLDMTRRAIGWLREAGIGSVNFDLMYGLPRQTVAGVVASIDCALEMEPDRIALFGYAHVPWMKPHQKLLPEGELPDGAARAAQAAAAATRLVERGYVRIGLDHFARPDDALARQLASGALHRNFQGYTTDAAPVLLGFGVSAIGILPQGYVQNTTDIPRYRQSVLAGRFATVRGLPLGGENRLRRAVIERLMCDMEVDLAAVALNHGSRPDHFIPELVELDDLIADGIACRDGWTISLTEAGRPLVRAVCAIFDAYLGAGAGRHSRAI
jgi:oxygen-independent coproporphyrinogen-3 oxidase